MRDYGLSAVSAAKLAGASSLVLAVALTASQAAYAQTTDTRMETKAQTAPEPILDQPNSDIVVTARRSTERLQDVPLSISAIGDEALVNQGISDFDDVAAYTPGLSFRDFVSGFNGVVTLRGLAQANVQNAVGNVGVFVDGIYLQRGYMVNFTLADIERIEVVKGPQSALYGQNTFSGAINVVTKKPTDEWTVNGNGTIGSAGRKEFRIGAGGPIIPGILGVRGFYGKSEYGGTYKNNFPGVTGDFRTFGGYDREAYSGSLRFTPTNTITVEASYQHLDTSSEQRPYYTVDGTFIEDKLNCGPLNQYGTGQLFCGTLPTNPDVLRSGANPNRPSGLISVQQPPILTSSKIIRVSAAWEFADGFQLSYLFGDAKGAAQENLSFPANGYNPIGRPTITQQKEGGTLDFQSHEARLAYDGNGGPLSGEVGYYHSKAYDNFLFGFAGFFPVNTPLTLPSKEPFSTGADNGLGIPFTIRKSQYTTDAIFGRVSFDFMDDRANLSLEGRYTWTDVLLEDILARRNEVAAGRDPDVNTPILTDSFKDFTPRITATYKLTPDNLVYVSAAKGVKAGGFNGYVTGTVQLTPEERIFGQESNWTYEFGTKNEFFNRTLTLNAAIFYVDWTNQQISVVPKNFPLNNTTQGQIPPSIYQAVGNSTNWGVEIEGQYRPTTGLNIGFSLAYSDPTYSKGSIDPTYTNLCDDVACAKSGDVSGNSIPGTPNWSGTLSADYTMPIGDKLEAFVGADMNYQGSYYVQSANITKLGAVTLFNARAGVEYEGVRGFLWVKNLTNEAYLESSFVIASLRQLIPSYGEKRTWGATVAFDF